MRRGVLASHRARVRASSSPTTNAPTLDERAEDDADDASARAALASSPPPPRALGRVRVRVRVRARRRRGRVVLDASGQKGVIPRELSRQRGVPGLENTAVYAHYEGVRLDPGIDAGSTLIYRLDAKSWIWFIPLPDAVSIGLVTSAREILRFGRNRDEILQAGVDRCPHLKERLVDAKISGEVRVARDFSYRAERDGGPGWALIGDALGFIDPVYSTGLLLSVRSAELLASEVTCALASSEEHPDLRGRSGDWQVAFDRFLPLVRAFYTEDFRFGELSKHDAHRQGLTDLLTGIVDTEEAIGVTAQIQRMFDEEVAQGS